MKVTYSVEVENVEKLLKQAIRTEGIGWWSDGVRDEDASGRASLEWDEKTSWFGGEPRVWGATWVTDENREYHIKWNPTNDIVMVTATVKTPEEIGRDYLLPDFIRSGNVEFCEGAYGRFSSVKVYMKHREIIFEYFKEYVSYGWMKEDEEAAHKCCASLWQQGWFKRLGTPIRGFVMTTELDGVKYHEYTHFASEEDAEKWAVAHHKVVVETTAKTKKCSNWHVVGEGYNEDSCWGLTPEHAALLLLRRDKFHVKVTPCFLRGEEATGFDETIVTTDL